MPRAGERGRGTCGLSKRTMRGAEPWGNVRNLPGQRPRAHLCYGCMARVSTDFPHPAAPGMQIPPSSGAVPRASELCRCQRCPAPEPGGGWQEPACPVRELCSSTSPPVFLSRPCTLENHSLKSLGKNPTDSG